MILLQEPTLSEESKCPYISQNSSRNVYFYAKWVDDHELDQLLSEGWRRFAQYYFRPQCRFCKSCTPIRIPVKSVIYSRSKRKVLKRNTDLTTYFKPKKFSNEMFKIYQKHSERFGQSSTVSSFIEAHFNDTCNSFQSEYYLGKKLIAVGFIDRSSKALSSSYFFYDTDFKDRSLGFYSIMKEIEHANVLGLSYYYLGYYIKENHFMSYKNSFYPHELMEWDTENWIIQNKKG